MGQIDTAYSVNRNKLGLVMQREEYSASLPEFMPTLMPLYSVPLIFTEDMIRPTTIDIKGTELVIDVGEITAENVELTGLSVFQFPVGEITDIDYKTLAEMEPEQSSLSFNVELANQVYNYETLNFNVTDMNTDTASYNPVNTVRSSYSISGNPGAFINNYAKGAYQKEQFSVSKSIAGYEIEQGYAIFREKASYSVEPKTVRLRAEHQNIKEIIVDDIRLEEQLFSATELMFVVSDTVDDIILNDKFASKIFSFSVDDANGLPTTPTLPGSGNIEALRFIVQKLSFVEIYIKFTSNKITAVTGLPNGMILEGDYIKGSPTVSGMYPVNIFSESTRIMQIVIEVPSLQRKL